MENEHREANKEEPIQLSPDTFIEALKGKTVIDKKGKEISFLREKHIGEETAVVIQNVLVTDPIVIKDEKSPFNLRLQIKTLCLLGQT